VSTYKAKVEAHAATRLAIFCQHCQSKAAANEDEEELGDVKRGFGLRELRLLYSHADWNAVVLGSPTVCVYRGSEA
jgi:hypothetical protein